MQVSSNEICLILQLSSRKSPHRNNKSPLKLEHLQRSGLQRRLSSKLYQKCSVKMRRLYKRTLNKQRKNFLEKRRKPKKMRKPKTRLRSQEILQKLRRRNKVGRNKN